MKIENLFKHSVKSKLQLGKNLGKNSKCISMGIQKKI